MNRMERTIADSECKESKIIMNIMNETGITTLQVNDEGYSALYGFNKKQLRSESRVTDCDHGFRLTFVRQSMHRNRSNGFGVPQCS
jgi:hypothetical protein